MFGTKLIAQSFENFRINGKIALIPYITAFDPNKAATIEFLKYIAEADPLCIELGFPFSDPVADGPTIQKAMVRALQNAPTFEEYLDVVSRFKHNYPHIPVLSMTYFNIIYRYGLKKAINDALAAKLDGFIIPDLPLEEAEPWLKLISKTPLAHINLAAPTSDEERIKKLAKSTRGFLYYVSLTGVTGAREELPKDLKERLLKIKKCIEVPLAVGFGISKPEHVFNLKPYADAVVVGSALVKIIEEKKARAGEELYKFLKTLKNENP
ncbi:MAG: tryptophan synthase subunit alpha [Caldimicrobium sp.]